MAEATEPIHFLDVCSQKFSEFMFNAEHKCLMWLREIEEEAMKMFDSNLSAEPALIPKTPSQKKHRKKKRSSSFKDVDKELTRKRLSKRRSGIKPASSIELFLSKENPVVTASCKMNLFTKETLEAQCDKTVMHPSEEATLGVNFNKNIEVRGKMDAETSSIPEVFTMCPDGPFADRVGATEAAGISNVFAVMLLNPLDPARTGKDWNASRLSTSTPTPSLNVKPARGGELLLAQQVDNNLVQEETISQDLKDSSGTSGGSRSGHRPSNRPHKSKRVSLVEKYSLASKRKSMIRKSISKSIAKKKAARNSSSTSSRVSCHSSFELLMDGETSKNGTYCTFSPESLAIKMTGSQVNGSEDSAQSSQCHEQSIRSQSYKQALDELPTAQPTKYEDLSTSSKKTSSPPANKTLSPSGPARITRPFRNFFQTMQKSQLFKPPGSPGPSSIMKSLVKPTMPATKPDTREKERQRLESLRKKQEAEQQRKQKVEEEKRRRLEEIKLKREERLRKALQARERVEQMEEEKRKRMEQKFSQHEERSEKVREEKTAEEKTKRKVSVKKLWDTETRKQKSLQMFQEEEQKLQEQPEKWKTVGEIKKMLEHNNAKQANERHHGQQDKEKWVKQLELAVVTEEEENQKKSPISTSNHVNPKDLKDSKSLKINPNDYGMDLNSDDSTDDESQPRKPIPPWATGLQLNEAVTYQYYNPPDTDTFFGQILSPKLEDIFYKSKPRYFKRTSSAVWQSPPLPGTRTALRSSSSMKKY
uniref:inner centromere protein-like n=1 Tax=Euleptes europaea TaxID=460621 RepID=UPI002540E8C4|nr:inner centromere protein-like [Euleptes europaea]